MQWLCGLPHAFFTSTDAFHSAPASLLWGAFLCHSAQCWGCSRSSSCFARLCSSYLTRTEVLWRRPAVSPLAVYRRVFGIHPPTLPRQTANMAGTNPITAAPILDPHATVDRGEDSGDGPVVTVPAPAELDEFSQVEAKNVA